MAEYKGYRIVGDGTFGLKRILNAGKGMLPRDLSGTYTSAIFAERDIDGYLEKKGKTNGETDSGS